MFLDLRGEKKTFTQPLICNPNEKTIIQNGELEFRNCDRGIFFWPTKPRYPVRVSNLTIRDVDIHNPDGLGLQLVGCGKETHLSNVKVTAKGGALIKDWDGGVIDNLYAFDCRDFGISLQRIHAAQINITARQTRNGPGVMADALRGVNAQIYSESNDLIGLQLSNARELVLMAHLENNNRGITGETNWESMGHRFQQADFRNCQDTVIRGFWGKRTGQWRADDSTARAMLPNLVRGIHLQPQTWSNTFHKRWGNVKYRPMVSGSRIAYPAGCFSYNNVNRGAPAGRLIVSFPGGDYPAGTQLQATCWIQLPKFIHDELRDMHNRGKENAMGTLGFGGFNYNPTFYQKGYVPAHPWMGFDFAAAQTETIIQGPLASPAHVTYTPHAGLADWDNPEFNAIYHFSLKVF